MPTGDNLSSTLTDWLFANDRQVGDTTIVEVTDSSGNVTGYQILYLESFGEIRWKSPGHQFPADR